jgi:hypothetical protein
LVRGYSASGHETIAVRFGLQRSRARRLWRNGMKTSGEQEVGG